MPRIWTPELTRVILSPSLESLHGPEGVVGESDVDHQGSASTWTESAFERNGQWFLS